MPNEPDGARHGGLDPGEWAMRQRLAVIGGTLMRGGALTLVLAAVAYLLPGNVGIPFPVWVGVGIAALAVFACDLTSAQWLVAGRPAAIASITGTAAGVWAATLLPGASPALVLVLTGTAAVISGSVLYLSSSVPLEIGGHALLRYWRPAPLAIVAAAVALSLWLPQA